MKKFFIYFSLSIFTTMGIYVMITAAGLPRTYNGKNINTDVIELQKDSKNNASDNIDGISNVIVSESLDKTRALNTVNAVALDYRGYDGLGQIFLLFTAISGSALILRSVKKGEEKSNE